MSYFGSTEWYIKVKQGLIPGYSVVNKFGAIQGVGTSYTVISPAGVYQTPTAAASLEFVSTSAADALNGAGAREITFVGLDASWAEQTVTMATHATDGTTAVAITGTWMRLYRWYVSQSGTYATATAGSHVGTITTRVAGAGATWSTLGLTAGSIGRGQSQIACYTVPITKTGYIISKQLHADAGKSSDFILYQRPNANDVATPFTGTLRTIEEEVGITTGSVYNPNCGLGPFVGPCDLIFKGRVLAATGDLSIDFEILLVDD